MQRFWSDLIDSAALSVARALPDRVAKWCVVITLAKRPEGFSAESIKDWAGEVSAGVV